MRVTTLGPLRSHIQKILPVECQQDTALVGCIGELGFIGLTEIAGLNRGLTINLTIAKHASKEGRQVFVKIELHQSREGGGTKRLWRGFGLSA